MGQDIPVSEIGSHFQTFSVADEGLGGVTFFFVGLHYLQMPSFGKKIACIAVYPTIDQLRS